MFSQSIQGMIQSSNMKSAQQRIVQIESILAAQTKKALSVEQKTEKKVKLPVFSDYMKSDSSEKLKYKVAELPSVSEGQIRESIKSISAKYGIDDRLVSALIA